MNVSVHQRCSVCVCVCSLPWVNTSSASTGRPPPPLLFSINSTPESSPIFVFTSVRTTNHFVCMKFAAAALSRLYIWVVFVFTRQALLIALHSAARRADGWVREWPINKLRIKHTFRMMLSVLCIASKVHLYFEWEEGGIASRGARQPLHAPRANVCRLLMLKQRREFWCERHNRVRGLRI